MRPAWGDVIAGVSVALVLVPQSLAYAQLAGMPAYRGLYAAILPPLAAALVASSPYLQTGPVALTSLLSFGALSTVAAPGSDEYVELGLLLALVVGVVRLAIGLVRAGVVAYLISQPMLLGFVPAAGTLIVASQVPAALGAEPPEGGILRSAVWALVHPSAWDVAAVAFSVGTILVVAASRRLHQLFPGVLVAAALGIVASCATGYDGATVGAIPSGLPPLSLSFPWGDLGALLLPGVIIALVGFVEPSTIARTYAARERRPWSADREFASQGLANVAAGVSGGFPVGGSFSRSALNYAAGARTRWSGAITGLAVLCFLPFASALERLPLAVLSGLVIGAVVGLVRPAPAARLARFSKPQFAVATATFVLTLALAPRIDIAVLVGVVLAVAVHLWRELRLELTSWREGEALHLRPRGVLWFGTEGKLEREFLAALAGNTSARNLVVHLDGLGRIDITGALALRALLQDARAGGLAFQVVDIRERWQPLVERIVVQDEDPLGRPS